VRRTDPGDPEKCPVFTLHRVYTPEAERTEQDRGCRTAAIGCVDCKRVLIGHLNRFLAPLRRRREEFSADPDRVWRLLDEGTERAREVARGTMAEVRAVLKL
jgi:tryptophanyl-tRNA synthetase